MKVLVVLVLVVFTGCNANSLNAERRKPKLEVIRDFLWDCFLANVGVASEIDRSFRRTEFGKAVTESLNKVARTAERFVDTVMRSLPPTTKAIIATSAEASFDLVSHVMNKVKDRLESTAESAAPVMEEALGELFVRSQLVHEMVSPYITEMMEKSDPFFQDIRARLHALNKNFFKTE